MEIIHISAEKEATCYKRFKIKALPALLSPTKEKVQPPVDSVCPYPSQITQPRVALRKDSTEEEMGAEAVRANRTFPPKLACNQKR